MPNQSDDEYAPVSTFSSVNYVHLETSPNAPHGRSRRARVVADLVQVSHS